MPSSSSSSLFFDRLPLLGGMKFAFKIKTKPVTQAAIIIIIIAFALGLLALIAIYLRSPLVGIVCAIVLAIIVYLALCLAPC
jgi:hypothetical protein